MLIISFHKIAPGKYNVYVSWPDNIAASIRATSVPVVINAAGRNSKAFHDQDTSAAFIDSDYV